ncbi:hypothetical protein CDD82_3446 [Ophiocordyceps australis]|uniref:Filamentation protein n=1 Tax=Ophiocordyceps australis TaxID=1399860 RepID=A0A2C5Z9B9_9HYPO|nr:hypothetical protein CDD82_3446 [Ophiocordyceps australis]
MTTKALHYLEQLESARCDGNWDAVPELVRKVRKHAPHKSCLALTTETECAISNATTTASRPSTSATPQELQVETRLPKLVEAAQQEPLHSQDRFQAQVCIGWLHWVVGEYHLALEQLPTAKACGSTESDPACPSSEWTHVCALKSAYLRANCLTRALRMKEALAALEAASPVLERVWTRQGIRKQLRNWSELFLTEYCQLSSAAIDKNELSLDDPSTLAPFRAWTKYWEVMQTPFAGGSGFKGLVPRRQIWSEYYSALSRILESDISFDPPSTDANTKLSSRAQLATELKHAEKALRTLLLSETTFPRADEERPHVEALVKQVVKNWSIMCGRAWRQEDLGQGGRFAMSRGVLEILYSAATRTFHSTAILRSLFIVHLSIAEFALAFKALDSYLAIVKKAKARMDKTGQAEPSCDSDEMVLQTMAQGVLALCRYGHREAGEKAHVLGAEIEDLLSKLPQIKATQNGTSPIAEESVKKTPETVVSPQIVAAAWQAIGLSHANWSRLTFEAASRTEIQAKAIRCLRQSLSAEYGCSKDVRSCFSLALLLAERRDITAAIELVKYALMSNKDHDGGYDLLRGQYWQERADLSLWHLLALLLSVKPDYDASNLACASALEQFKDSAVLFGPANSSFRSEHLNEADSVVVDSQRGLVDDMDDWERETLLEIKTTQLSILELSAGPDMAVNSSYELLTLFTRLFGNVKVKPVATATPTPSQPPRTSATFRSIRGSIFGLRTDRSPSTARRSSISELSEKADPVVSRPTTMQNVTATRPAIQITEANGNQLGVPKTRRASSTNRQRNRSLSRRRNSLKKRDRSTSFHGPETVARFPLPTNGAEASSGLLESDSPTGTFVFTSKPSQVRVPSFSGGRALSLGSRASIASKPTDLSGLEADKAQTMPPLLPFVQLPKDKEKARRLATLVKIWLTVAGFYRRAGLAEDSKEAIAEAQKLVQGMETDSCRAQEGTASQEAGWAEQASIDDLWGDVWCELGLLALAQDEPYTARSDFELSLTHCPNHATAIVNLCNILLDIYSEKILPPPVVPPLNEDAESDTDKQEKLCQATIWTGSLPCRPLGLGPSGSQAVLQANDDDESEESSKVDKLPAPYKATHLPLADRLAARDRAFTLLSGLTRLGSGWNDSEAWFALARAYEESGQVDKAKEVLWWCVELEEARAVRAWRCVGNGGYIV